MYRDFELAADRLGIDLPFGWYDDLDYIELLTLIMGSASDLLLELEYRIDELERRLDAQETR